MSIKIYDVNFINDDEVEVIGLTKCYHTFETGKRPVAGAVGLLNFHEDGSQTYRLMYVYRTNDPEDGHVYIEFFPLYDEDGNTVILKSENLHETPFAILNFNYHTDKTTGKDIDDNLTIDLWKA